MKGNPASQGAAGSPSAGASRTARPVRFTYLDYLELRAWEFRKFRAMPPITIAEIAALDWKEVTRRLVELAAEVEN